MKLTGHVISIDDHKGFIKNFDKTFYFNKSSFVNKTDFDIIKNGEFLEFEAIASSKGMRAKNISIIQTHIGFSIIDKLIISSAVKNIQGIDLLNGFFVNSKWHKSPQDCKDELINIAKINNLNFVEFQPIQKSTFYKGNYKYTMHSFTAFIGLAAKKENFTLEKDAKQKNIFYDEKFKQVTPIFKVIAERQNEDRACQESFFYSLFLPIIKLIKFLFKVK